MLDTQFKQTLAALREIYEKHPHPFRGVAGGGKVTPKVKIGIAYTPPAFERRSDGVYQCLMPSNPSISMSRLQEGLLRDRP